MIPFAENPANQDNSERAVINRLLADARHIGMTVEEVTQDTTPEDEK